MKISEDRRAAGASTHAADETDAAQTDAARVAADRFGIDRLRDWQERAIAAACEGRDVLLVESTGGGKSLVYQVAGTLRTGWTLVVSPLLALQADQVAHLTERGVRASRLSSDEGGSRRGPILREVAQGDTGFLFVAPEQMGREDFRALLDACPPSLVAVDEAHCVSEWGHDFRPDYLRVGRQLCALDDVPVLALTATASPPVRASIVDLLCLEEPLELVGDLGRGELTWSVLPEADEDARRDRVERLVLDHPSGTSGLVYCRTRAEAEWYAARLVERGREAAFFHAGLGRRRRGELHAAFLDGSVEVLVATSAFGMGIDKPDVRFVVHAGAPPSIDAYLQESGRAGRDGLAATATLVYRPEDLALGRFFAGGAPRRQTVSAVLGALQRLGADPDALDDVDPDEVAATAQLGRATTLRVLDLLDGAERPTVSAVRERARSRSRAGRSRVEQVRSYAETDRCRAEFLLSYFGQVSDPCRRCDRCETGQPAAPAGVDTPRDAPVLQQPVRHPTFGSGTVTEVLRDRVTVLFDDVGYRTLAWDVVREHGLLSEEGSAGDAPLDATVSGSAGPTARAS